MPIHQLFDLLLKKQILYNHAVLLAVELGKQSIWLGVWEQNHRAIRFYKKNGFVEFDRHIFRLGGRCTNRPDAEETVDAAGAW